MLTTLAGRQSDSDHPPTVSLHKTLLFLQETLYLTLYLVLTSYCPLVLYYHSIQKACLVTCTYSPSTKISFFGNSQHVDSCWCTSIRNLPASTPAWSHSQFYQPAYSCTHPHGRQWGVPRVNACCREHKNLLQRNSSPITRLGRLLVARLFKGVSS